MTGGGDAAPTTDVQKLILDRVTVSRGAGPVIREVSLELRSGEITALVGPNGAGKTSLLESISGVIRASSGRMIMNDEPFDNWPRARRARAGIVHIEQGRTVFASLTVLENLRLAAHSPDQLEQALALFPELVKRKDSPSGLLSGGEQQMVVLARAFASRPRFLLIDEMSLGLAPVVFNRLLPMVQQIAGSGVGVLLVEQFTQLALGLARQAFVISGGEVTFAGAAATLHDQPDLLHAAYLGEPPPVE